MADALPPELHAEFAALAERLTDPNGLGQQHIMAQWPAAGSADVEKRQCLEQLLQLDASYPGGLAAYVASARKLLEAVCALHSHQCNGRDCVSAVSEARDKT